LCLEEERVETDAVKLVVNRIRRQRADRLENTAIKSVTTRGIRERYAANWTSIIQFMKMPVDPPITGLGVVLYGFYAPPTVMIYPGSVLIDSRACIQLARENGAALRRAAVVYPDLIEDFRPTFDDQKNMRAYDDTYLSVRLLDSWCLPDTVLADSPRAYTRGTDMFMSVCEDFDIVPLAHRFDRSQRAFQYVRRLYGVTNGTDCNVGFFVIDAALSMVIGHLTTLLDHIPTIAQLIGEHLICETWTYDFYSESAFGRRLVVEFNRLVESTRPRLESGEATLKRSRFEDIDLLDDYYPEDEADAAGPVGAPYNGAMVDDFPA